MSLNLFKKINVKDINLTANNSNIIFSYILNEKQEKELNIAAGKIHRNITQQDWKVEGTRITLTISKEQIKNVAFGEIKDLFEEMVK